MRTSLLAAALLVSTSMMAVADDSLPAKAKDTPSVTGPGTTADPTVKPDTGDLTDKAMKDQPGVTGTGPTVDPTAKPEDGSLSSKVKKDTPAVQ